MSASRLPVGRCLLGRSQPGPPVSPAKSNHFVPEFYLRRFAEPIGKNFRIFTRDLEDTSRAAFPQGTDQAAMRNQFATRR